MVMVFFVFSPRAISFTLKSSLMISASSRSLFFSRTLPPLINFETVAIERPVFFATSLIVAYISSTPYLVNSLKVNKFFSSYRHPLLIYHPARSTSSLYSVGTPTPHSQRSRLFLPFVGILHTYFKLFGIDSAVFT